MLCAWPTPVPFSSFGIAWSTSIDGDDCFLSQGDVSRGRPGMCSGKGLRVGPDCISLTPSWCHLSFRHVSFCHPYSLSCPESGRALHPRWVGVTWGNAGCPLCRSEDAASRELGSECTEAPLLKQNTVSIPCLQYGKKQYLSLRVVIRVRENMCGSDWNSHIYSSFNNLTHVIVITTCLRQ